MISAHLILFQYAWKFLVMESYLSSSIVETEREDPMDNILPSKAQLSVTYYLHQAPSTSIQVPPTS